MVAKGTRRTLNVPTDCFDQFDCFDWQLIKGNEINTKLEFNDPLVRRLTPVLFGWIYYEMF